MVAKGEFHGLNARYQEVRRNCGLLGSQKVSGAISTLQLNALLHLHLAPITLRLRSGLTEIKPELAEEQTIYR